MWEAWITHHQHGRDSHWPMTKRSSGRRQKLVSSQVPFYVLVGKIKYQDLQKQDGRDKLKISKGIPRTKTQLDSTEKQLNLSGKFSQGFTTLTIFQVFQKYLEEKNIKSVFFKDRIIFMSVFNDILWKSDDQSCISNAEKVKNYARRFLAGHWNSVCPGSEKRWYGDSQGGQWDRTANKMVQQFKETGHPIFTVTSALSRRILKQRKGRSTIHFNGDSVNTELLFETHSVNQINVYAAVTDWCYQFVLTKEEKEKVAIHVDNRSRTWWNPKRKLPNIGKKGTNDTIMRKSLFPSYGHNRKSPPNSTRWGRRMTREITAWQLTKIRNKNDVIVEARNEGKTVLLGRWWISIISRIRNCNTNSNKDTSRVVLRGDIAKDDSGSYAIFTEQGSWILYPDCHVAQDK